MLQFTLVVIVLCYFGLPLMRVVNRVTYIALENGAFGLFTLLEMAIKNAKVSPAAEPAEVSHSLKKVS